MSIKQLTGLNRHSAQLLADHPHIHQAIDDILTTPLGSRVMRREYGSLLPDLIDRPMTKTLMMQLYAAIAIAVMKHEPRIRLTGIDVTYDAGGQMTFRIDYLRLHPDHATGVGLYKFSIDPR